MTKSHLMLHQEYFVLPHEKSSCGGGCVGSALPRACVPVPRAPATISCIPPRVPTPPGRVRENVPGLSPRH